VAPEHQASRIKKHLKKSIFKDFKNLLSLGKRSLKSIHKTLGRFLLSPNSLLVATDTFSEIPLSASLNFENKKKENMLRLVESNKTPDNIKKFFRSSARLKSKKIKNFF